MKKVSGMVAALTLVGCADSGSAQTASVTGDLYLVTEMGEVRQGAASMVHLIRRDGTPGEGWQEICEPQSAEFVRQLQEQVETLQELTRQREAAQAAGNSALVSELVDRARTAQASFEALTALQQRRDALERSEWITGMAVASASTGMNANYRLDVVPGPYWLFTTMSLGENDYWWVMPLELAPDEKRVLDLDNGNVLNREDFLCGNNPFL